MRRAFARAAPTYDAAAVLQREIGGRMAQRLDYVKLAPAAILDAGCGTGEAVGELGVAISGRARCSRSTSRCRWSSGAPARAYARIGAAPAAAAARAARGAAPPRFVCADINALPFAGVSIDLVWSNLALQWVNDLPRAFAEFRRVLKVGGLLVVLDVRSRHAARMRAAFAGATGTRISTGSSTCTTSATCW